MPVLPPKVSVINDSSHFLHSHVPEAMRCEKFSLAEPVLVDAEQALNTMNFDVIRESHQVVSEGYLLEKVWCGKHLHQEPGQIYI